MKNYVDTITKSKYKNYFEIDVNTFLLDLNKKSNTWQDIEETSFNWDIRISGYAKFEDLYNSDDMLQEAEKLIINKTNLSIKDIVNYKDNIIDDIMSSCDNAYENDYMSKMFTFTQNEIIDIINDELDFFDYQILYYSSEDKTLHNELKYNTDIIRIYFPISEIQKFKDNFNYDDYTQQEIIDNIRYEFSFNAVNYIYFDHYGNIASYDNWLEIFSEYEEVSYFILKERKTKHNKLKNRIKHYEINKIKNMQVLSI